MTNPSQSSAQRVTLPFDTIIDSVIQQAHSQLSTGRKAGPCPIIQSDPGLGKSQVLEHEATTTLSRLLSSPVYFHSFNALQVNYLDISGALYINQSDPTEATLDSTRPADIVLPARATLAAYKYVVILVDEIDKGPIENKQVLANLLQDNRLGLYELPYDRFFVCAAGNLVTSRTGGTELFSHTVNRVRLHEALPSTRRWLEDYAPNPKNRVPPMARAFVEERADLFNSRVVIPTTANTPYLTLRSFTQGVEGLAYILPLGIDPKKIDPTDPTIFAKILSPDIKPLAQAFLAGSIGAGAAREYLEWANNHTKLPTRQQVESDPQSAKLPTFAIDPSAMHTAASYLLAWAADQTCTRAQLEAYGTYAARFDANKRANLMFALNKQNHKFSTTKAFSKFALENPELCAAMLAK